MIFEPARRFILPLLVSACVLTACGRDEFKKGAKMEKLGRHSTALTHYENFLYEKPGDPRAPEAAYRVGEIYRRFMHDNAKASYYFNVVKDRYKNSLWEKFADLAMMNTPDYFPFNPALKRTLGDSQSGGSYMKNIEVLESGDMSSDRAKISRATFAGTQKVSSFTFTYIKEESQLREYLPARTNYTILILYPPVKGKTWETERDGRRAFFTIESVTETVETKAGTFANCLKIKEEFADMKSSWKYSYYAPDIGLVLTATATPLQETRIIELVSHSTQ